MTAITIIDHQRRFRLQDVDRFSRLAERAVELGGLAPRLHPHDELQIHLVNIRTISRINREFVGHRGPTDVITFSYLEAPPPPAGTRTAAELFVCPEVAARRVAAGPDKKAEIPVPKSLGEEVALYLVHGILHLCGLDDQLPSQSTVMRRTQQQVLGSLAKEFDLAGLFLPDRARTAT